MYYADKKRARVDYQKYNHEGAAMETAGLHRHPNGCIFDNPRGGASLSALQPVITTTYCIKCD